MSEKNGVLLNFFPCVYVEQFFAEINQPDDYREVWLFQTDIIIPIY